MNELITIQGIRGKLSKTGNVLLSLEDVARGLGIVKREVKSSITYERINKQALQKWLFEFGILNSERNELPELPELIPENIFYKLCFKANNDKALEFQRMVTDEILPQIRATGGYIPTTAEDTEQDILAKAVIIANNTIERQNKRLAALQAELDNSRQWYTIKRVALLNGVSWKRLDWKELKRVSSLWGYEVKKIFDANYGTVNSYHQDVWNHVYPDFKL